MSKKLTDAIVNMKEKEALEIAKTLIEGGEDPLKILGACKEGAPLPAPRCGGEEKLGTMSRNHSSRLLASLRFTS